MSVMFSQSTALTPNSNCSVTGFGHANNTTTIVFMSPKNGTHRATLTVSQENPAHCLSQDHGDGTVIFKQGLTAALFSQGDSGHSVFLTGKIQDSGTEYNFTGMMICESTGIQADAIIDEPVETFA